MVVVCGVFFFLAILTTVSMYRSDKKFTGEIRYENLPPEQRRRIERMVNSVPVGDNDKNVRYAERVREASSIGLGLSLFLIGERVSKNRVMTLPQVMKEFSSSELLPPGVVVLSPERSTSYGLLQTERGIYFINYSPKPLKIEILAASPNGLTDGAVFILRVPDASAANMKPPIASSKVSSAGAWASIFEAPENENHYIPPPFSPVETFTAMNWQIRPLLQAEILPEKMNKLNNFLQRQN